MHEVGQLGHYQLVELLGQGGMGAVFRGRHTELGVERAVKVLTGAPSPRRVERFLRETQALARVQHPNVVRIHEAGHDPVGGSLYYAMDLVEGEPLHEVTERGRLGWGEAIDVSIAICEGVDALHAQGVVHRDLKPANIVLGPDGPVVLDLGLARDVEREEEIRLTLTGALLGTPMYMAPEQASSSRVTPAADVYALGLIVHELVSGFKIGDSGTVPGLAEPPSPSSLDGSLPRAIDEVVARALDRDPERRFARAGELAAALRAVRDRPGISRRMTRALTVGGSLLGVGLAVGLAARFAPAASERAVGPQAKATASSAPSVDVEGGAAELRAIKRVVDPARRYAALERWLKRYPAHPERSRAEALRREARRLFPLRVLLNTERRQHHYGFAQFTGRREILGSWTSGPTERRMWRWSLEPFKELGSWTTEALGPSGRAYVTPIPGGRLCGAVEAGAIRRFELDRPQVERSTIGWPSGEAPVIAWLGAGRVAIAAGEPSTITIMREGAGGWLQAGGTLGPLRGQVNAMAVSDDRRYLAACSNVEKTRVGMKFSAFYLFDLTSGAQVWMQPMMSRCRCVRFLPGSHRFVGGVNSGRLLLFEPGTRGAVVEFEGPGAQVRVDQGRNAHAGRLIDVAIRPDGKLLHSVGSTKDDKRGEWRTWSLVDRRQVGSTRYRPSPIRGASMSPDGALLVLSTLMGFEVWDASVE